MISIFPSSYTWLPLKLHNKIPKKATDDDVQICFLSYFANSQIWLNSLMDDHHLGWLDYKIVKKKKKTLMQIDL
jgi:hypothetical protein